MTRITIGLTSADWEVAAAARYYAERGNGEEFGFGMTPSQALARLEERERLAYPEPSEGYAEEVAFLALGAANLLREWQNADLSQFGGYMGFIGEVIRCAPVLWKRWTQIDAVAFPGVWLYDVTERFGHEWAGVLLTGAKKNPSERLESIISDELKK